MDTFKKPRDQFVDDVLEGLVRSGEKHTGAYQQPSDPALQPGTPLSPPFLRLGAWTLPLHCSAGHNPEGGKRPRASPPPPATTCHLGHRSQEG